MNRREIFNTLFEMGSDYEAYRRRGHRHVERSISARDAVIQDISNLNNGQVEFFNKRLKIIIISETWCSDCAKAVPVMAELADKFTNWQVSFVGKDGIQNEDIIDQFTTAGRFKIPVIVLADADGDEIARWVERPKRSYKLLADLQNQRLPKEQYIERYKTTPELQTVSVAKEFLREIMEMIDYCVSVVHILPSKKAV